LKQDIEKQAQKINILKFKRKQTENLILNNKCKKQIKKIKNLIINL